MKETFMVERPLTNEYSAFYETYIKLIPGNTVFEVLEKQLSDILSLSIPKEKEEYRYAEGKWTVKEVFGHIVDTERIMSYRALCFARNEEKKLPGFEENDYVAHGNFKDRTLSDILEEFEYLRKANLVLFKSFSKETVQRIGTASEKSISVRALIYIVAGHLAHHLNVLNTKYGI